MIWRKWKFWLALVLAATLIGALEGVQFYTGSHAMGYPVAWKRALAATMPSWYVLAMLLPLVLLVSRRFPLEPSRLIRSLAVHLSAAVCFALVHITGAAWLSYWLTAVLQPAPDAPWNFRTYLSQPLTMYFVVELVTYFAIVGAYSAYDYAQRYHERQTAAAELALRASRLEASLALANLDSLRMQLNPHFLFNTLNAVAVMAMKGERHGVVRMLTLLSDLLRLSLEQKRQLVTLHEELQFLDRYVEIEQVRFKDRLTFERDIADAALDAEVPSLLLQPLVENAIRHGTSRQTGPGTVRVEVRVIDGNVLELRVLDTGPGFNAAPSRGGTGVGIANTQARLEHLYGDRQEMSLSNREEGGACVTVRMPLRHAEPAPAAAYEMVS